MPSASTRILEPIGSVSTSQRASRDLCIQWALVHVICSSIIFFGDNNALYFMLAITHWFYHFYQRFSLFLVLALLSALGFIRRRKLPLKEIFPISISQFVLSTATCLLHSGLSMSSLFTLRLTDGLVTLLVVQLLPLFRGRSLPNQYRTLVILIAVSSSLAWLDFSMIEWSWRTIVAWPFIVVSSAFHEMITFTKQQKLGVSSAELMLYHSALSSIFLFPMAFLFPTTSPIPGPALSETASAWGIVDYVIITSATIYYAGLHFSKYWVMGYCEPETYAVARNAKYSLGAVGQMFVLSGQYANNISGLARIVAIFSAACFFYWKSKENETGTSQIGKSSLDNGEKRYSLKESIGINGGVQMIQKLI